MLDPLPDGAARVWFRLTTDADERAIAAATAALSPEEQARCSRLRRPQDRRDFAVAHALLRTTLTRYGARPPGSWTFSRGPSGKPALAAGNDAPDLRFNLAHTDGLVACVVSRTGEVGVDVEHVDRRVHPQELADRFFTRDEATWLAGCRDAERATRFTELWTLKEAYVKATGAGLSSPLDAFGFRLDGEDGLVFDGPPDAGPEWHFALWAPSPVHRMAVAVGVPPGRPCSVSAWLDRRGDREPEPVAAQKSSAKTIGTATAAPSAAPHQRSLG
jgi:4'-phosphopantetheinyl transferase